MTIEQKLLNKLSHALTSVVISSYKKGQLLIAGHSSLFKMMIKAGERMLIGMNIEFLVPQIIQQNHFKFV